MRLEQQMKLSPRLIQAMEILQLPLLALQERIEAEMESNPVLEMRDAEEDEQATPVKEDETPDRGERDLVVDNEHDNSADFERLADMEAEYGPEAFTDDMPFRRSGSGDGERDHKLDAMANTAAPDISLNEHLLRQWSFVETDAETHDAGKLIIGQIDDDGYLRTSLEELAQRTNHPLTIESLKNALPLVQTLEPIGVGARDLKECLLLQLTAEAAAGRDVSLETQIVQHFLRDIEMNRLPQIVRRTDRTIDEVKQAIYNISHLNPRPGHLIGKRMVPVVRPDVIVDVDDEGNIVVTMPDGNSPHLYIAKAYRQMARNRQTEKSARQFLQKNIRSAQWIIGAIQQRRETVRRVTEEVFKVQREFLDSGPEALKPLPMADIANKVGIHVATVSRAVAGKYAQTQRGIFPLRMFFSGGTKTAGGEDVAWDAVKAKLREVIDHEDKSKPFNDDQLAEELRKHGIDIARRTVAKYRNLMDIPPTRKRRQY